MDEIESTCGVGDARKRRRMRFAILWQSSEMMLAVNYIVSYLLEVVGRVIG